jgi:molybdopterin synthase catalytic subunit
MLDIQLLHDPLNADVCTKFVSSVAAGGVVTFIGSVRNSTKGRTVLRLEFEAYAPMAMAEMEKIGAAALQNFEIQSVSLHHRLGILLPEDNAVIIAVGAAHRAAAFAACAFCIDTLKETVPIWKKEIFTDGSVWVAAHP